jgi:hypothetical protein
VEAGQSQKWESQRRNLASAVCTRPGPRI